jgi:hypothetical protein
MAGDAAQFKGPEGVFGPAATGLSIGFWLAKAKRKLCTALLFMLGPAYRLRATACYTAICEPGVSGYFAGTFENASA